MRARLGETVCHITYTQTNSQTADLYKHPHPIRAQAPQADVLNALNTRPDSGFSAVMMSAQTDSGSWNVESWGWEG